MKETLSPLERLAADQKPDVDYLYRCFRDLIDYAEAENRISEAWKDVLIGGCHAKNPRKFVRQNAKWKLLDDYPRLKQTELVEPNQLKERGSENFVVEDVEGDYEEITRRIGSELRRVEGVNTPEFKLHLEGFGRMKGAGKLGISEKAFRWRTTKTLKALRHTLRRKYPTERCAAITQLIKTKDSPEETQKDLIAAHVECCAPCRARYKHHHKHPGWTVWLPAPLLFAWQKLTDLVARKPTETLIGGSAPVAGSTAVSGIGVVGGVKAIVAAVAVTSVTAVAALPIFPPDKPAQPVHRVQTSTAAVRASSLTVLPLQPTFTPKHAQQKPKKRKPNPPAKQPALTLDHAVKSVPQPPVAIQPVAEPQVSSTQQQTSQSDEFDWETKGKKINGSNKGKR